MIISKSKKIIKQICQPNKNFILQNKSFIDKIRPISYTISFCIMAKKIYNYNIKNKGGKYESKKDKRHTIYAGKTSKK